MWYNLTIYSRTLSLSAEAQQHVERGDCNAHRRCTPSTCHHHANIPCMPRHWLEGGSLSIWHETPCMAGQTTTRRRTADGLHVLGCLDVEHLAQLAEGRGAVVLPLKVRRGVRGCLSAAVAREVSLQLHRLSCSESAPQAAALASKTKALHSLLKDGRSISSTLQRGAEVALCCVCAGAMPSAALGHAIQA